NRPLRLVSRVLCGRGLGGLPFAVIPPSSRASLSSVTPMMELKPNAGSDRAWVWNTHADFADECPKPELLAIRFLNAENAQKFKTKFEECRKEIEEREKKAGSGKNDHAEKVAEKLEALSVKEETKEDAEEKQ
ncbi:ran-specific GTPase-activating protein-like, partial [Hylobates moloch]|uniref:ran-specific GTPase-activating protein-like n=1 Tax=Hylobates moloch TaxID=81572 RepID=UPI002676FD1A